jgi:hypothetical protein
MSAPRRRWRLVGLLVLAVVLGAGCDMASFSYYILNMGQEPMAEPGEMKLADKSKEIKAVILIYSGVETRPEFVTVDRELSGLLTHILTKSFKDNKEKVTLVSANKVQEYKNKHPDWYMKLEEVGRYFQADYVIFMNIESLSLYENGSGNTLYRGRANIQIELHNLNTTDEDPIKKSFRCEYPRSTGPIPVDDRSVTEFYQNFLNFIAKHLGYFFTAHPLEDDNFIEGP